MHFPALTSLNGKLWPAKCKIIPFLFKMLLAVTSITAKEVTKTILHHEWEEMSQIDISFIIRLSISPSMLHLCFNGPGWPYDIFSCRNQDSEYMVCISGVGSSRGKDPGMAEA